MYIGTVSPCLSSFLFWLLSKSGARKEDKDRTLDCNDSYRSPLAKTEKKMWWEAEVNYTVGNNDGLVDHEQLDNQI